MRLPIAVLISAGIACSGATSQLAFPGPALRISRYQSAYLDAKPSVEQAPDLILIDSDIACLRVEPDGLFQLPRLEFILSQSGLAKAQPVIQPDRSLSGDELPLKLLGTASAEMPPPEAPGPFPSVSIVSIDRKRVSIPNYKLEVGRHHDLVFVASESLLTQDREPTLSLDLASETASELLAILRDARPCP